MNSLIHFKKKMSTKMYKTDPRSGKSNSSWVHSIDIISMVDRDHHFVFI